MVTSTVTLPHDAAERQAVLGAIQVELAERARALGWRGQNEIARRAKINPGLASRALTGKVSAPGLVRRLIRAVERAEQRRRRREEGKRNAAA